MKRIQFIITSILAVLIPAAIAVAQAAPPQPNIQSGQRTPIWLGYLVAFIFAALLVLATLLPSKRAREDI